MPQPSKMIIARKKLCINRSSIRFQDTKIVQHLNILRYDTPFQFAYISAPEYRTEKFLYSRRSYESHLSNELCPSFLACLQPEKLSENCDSFFMNTLFCTFFKEVFKYYKYFQVLCLKSNYGLRISQWGGGGSESVPGLNFSSIALALSLTKIQFNNSFNFIW